MTRPPVCKNICIAFLTMFLLGPGVHAQTPLGPSYLQNELRSPAIGSFFSKQQLAKLEVFYAVLNYNPVWLRKENRLLLESLIRLIGCAEYDALNADDYAAKDITDYLCFSKVLPAAKDSVVLELRISMAAIDFFHDLKFGNHPPEFGYAGFAPADDDRFLITLVAQHVNERALHILPAKLYSQMPEVVTLTGKLGEMLDKTQRMAGWDPVINSNEPSNSNTPLVIKLYSLGIIDDQNAKLADTVWVQKIKAVQRMFNVQADGKMGKQTIQLLNVPVAMRIRELSRSINYYKWLSARAAIQRLIVVNIPSARLAVYDHDTTVLAMRVIVGKTSTPTPTLTSVVDKLVLYPFWTVPHSIATKELLPVFKRDPDYVQNGNYQVLSRAGKLVNPRSINWHNYNASNFPFTIRQSTGCDNALGLLKLDFENPYGVYLHDTPVKILFASSNRFLSHGCMRMEKPFEMGRLLLDGDNRAIDTLTEKGCLKNQAPIVVQAKIKMPVVVWYNTVTVNPAGFAVFHKDIYQKLPWLNNKQ
ncbi:L,D-transpeptidase family protein [Sediminibacterium roseum]|uniref:L,D-transpeptidase family protein n=1 Tax=Sediminibacterium roseum TaxID=1978412 RepID=A0ABX0A0G4_9BACT|nr:L,D-transpeptidase family protein [Sediminibacterium roseum]NCI52072.1 L,D-transpeptidase family protein [Sediminibacterium roseum]